MASVICTICRFYGFKNPQFIIEKKFISYISMLGMVCRLGESLGYFCFEHEADNALTESDERYCNMLIQ